LTANAIGGLSAFLFASASSQTLTGSGSTGYVINGTSGALFSWVVQPNTIGAAQGIMFFSEASSGSARFYVFIDTNGKLNVGIRRLDSDTGVTITGVTTLVANTPYLIVVYADVASGTVTVRLNGAPEVSGAPASSGNFAATPPQTVSIGSQAANNYFNGYIAETLQIPALAAAVFSTADANGHTPIQKLEGQQAHKYGIALPSSHPYYLSPP
jgi:hypothetical protein